MADGKEIMPQLQLVCGKSGCARNQNFLYHWIPLTNIVLVLSVGIDLLTKEIVYKEAWNLISLTIIVHTKKVQECEALVKKSEFWVHFNWLELKLLIRYASNQLHWKRKKFTQTLV